MNGDFGFTIANAGADVNISLSLSNAFFASSGRGLGSFPPALPSAPALRLVKSERGEVISAYPLMNRR